MKNAPQGFRERITVFGETYRALLISEEVADEPLVLYENTKAKKDKPKVATVDDWMEWDKNAREAKAE